jgi:hypothetical protein
VQTIREGLQRRHHTGAEVLGDAALLARAGAGMAIPAHLTGRLVQHPLHPEAQAGRFAHDGRLCGVEARVALTADEKIRLALGREPVKVRLRDDAGIHDHEGGRGRGGTAQMRHHPLKVWGSLTLPAYTSLLLGNPLPSKTKTKTRVANGQAVRFSLDCPR